MPIHCDSNWRVMIAFMILAIPGCSVKDWVITVENKSDTPCSFFDTHETSGGSGEANLPDLIKGERITLLRGHRDVTINTMRVVQGDKEQIVESKTKLKHGDKLVIVLNADGKLETSVERRGG